MEKIVVLSCTNRPNSNTLKVSKIYANLLRDKNIDVKILDFCLLPQNIAFAETFGNRSKEFEKIITEYVTSCQKFVFVLPEYNGSFPGILKTFIDSMHPSDWHHKNACLVGVADGRAGNLRGMDHLTGILNYLKMNVYHDKLPISVINRMFDLEGNFTPEQLAVSKRQIDGFLKY